MTDGSWLFFCLLSAVCSAQIKGNGWGARMKSLACLAAALCFGWGESSPRRTAELAIYKTDLNAAGSLHREKSSVSGARYN